jgi:hypothetical protein
MIYDLVLEDIINNTLKNDITHLYGNDSEIKVNYFKYSTNTSKYIIDCTLMISEIENNFENHPYGLHLLIEESLKCIAFTEPYIISSSVKLNKI